MIRLVIVLLALVGLGGYLFARPAPLNQARQQPLLGSVGSQSTGRPITLPAPRLPAQVALPGSMVPRSLVAATLRTDPGSPANPP
ncbi:MAG TPA: hypothetical protein VHB98_09440, partial [Chloroflexota bacterium]|nr:hypothetical protein [Chloroflexota bacterium]